MNGDAPALWEKVNRIAEYGCALRGTHEQGIQRLEEGLETERKEREAMGKDIIFTVEKVRNQILIGMLLVMALTLVIDKVLK